MFEGRHKVRVAAAGLVAVAALSVLAACGGSSTSNTTSAPASPSVSAATNVTNDGPHNQADIDFLQGMIPHHEQAIAMAQMVPTHTSDPAILKLASQIEAAQAPEIAEMTDWLNQWGVAVTPSMAGHDMSGGSMGAGGHGMMTPEEMTGLGNAKGARFDQMWLSMMIEHHEGAVTMSKQELSQGENPQARALAQNIIDGQTKEIEQMKAMLKQ